MLKRRLRFVLIIAISSILIIGTVAFVVIFAVIPAFTKPAIDRQIANGRYENDGNLPNSCLLSTDENKIVINAVGTCGLVKNELATAPSNIRSLHWTSLQMPAMLRGNYQVERDLKPFSMDGTQIIIIAYQGTVNDSILAGEVTLYLRTANAIKYN